MKPVTPDEAVELTDVLYDMDSKPGSTYERWRKHEGTTLTSAQWLIDQKDEVAIAQLTAIRMTQ